MGVRALGALIVVCLGWSCALHADAYGAGSAVFVDGKRVRVARVLPKSARVMLTNGVVRVTLPVSNREQRAGHRLQLLRNGRWVDATAPSYGDWTFVGSSVDSKPTRVTVLEATANRVAVKWSYGDHTVSGSYTADHKRRKYPFTKTVWLRSGESGYYTLVKPVRQLAPSVGGLEHEVGFGGVFGPAGLTYPGGSFRASPMLSQSRVVPWMQLQRDGDPLARVVVPFPASELVVPAFGSGPFGSVYVHQVRSASYGAYLHAAVGGDPMAICRAAWRHRPGPLRTLASTGSCSGA
jgi:hypothetical protein